MRLAVPYLLPLLILIAGCRVSGPVHVRDGGGDAAAQDDTDGDTIGDDDEGSGSGVDTDDDGTPDYQDDDSDNDGIPDSIEAGDANVGSPPNDSDADGTPDFRDNDSDGNGIADGIEIDGDIDGDGTPNFADTDDDGDYIRDVDELAGNLANPPDFDMDGNPDFQDIDSDNDTISDNHERDADTDNDGQPDANDLDSDRDGVIDSIEAGDANVATPPDDADMDGTPNFRDPDSDNDGLSDGDEAFIHHTSPVDDDSDNDGVTDLIEIGAGTDPSNMADSPRTRGNFVFVVPYMEPPQPERDTLKFRTSIQFADVYFLFDISGSMAGEITALRDAVTTIMADLTCADTGTPCMRDTECSGGNVCSPFTNTCIEDPSATSCVASVFTGTGYYEASVWNTRSLQGDPAATRAAINTSTFGGTEVMWAAAQAVAEPGTSGAAGTSGCTGPVAPNFIGCPSFRREAVRILTMFSDENSDGGTVAAASAALRRQNITFIGVNSGAARADFVSLATAAGSLDRAGNPLVFDGSDSGVVPVVTNAINEIVEGVPLRVTIEATDEPDDAGDALQFIAQLVTNTDPAAGCSMEDVEDANGDGVTETYPSVTPGTPVCWDVVARQNDTVMPAATPLVFIAKLTVYGDGSPLDARLVYFLVPPAIPDPGGPD